VIVASDASFSIIRKAPPTTTHGRCRAHGFFFPTQVSVPLAAVARVDADGIWLSRTGDEVRQETGDGGASAAAPVELAGAPS
jgi:hypothetical protein